MGLQGFRDTKSSGLIYIVFAVIIVVFVFMFGLPSTELMGGGDAKRVAKIGDHVIDSDLLKSMIMRHYRDEVFSKDNFDEYELDMTNKLATVFLLADDARDAGLRVSEEEWNDYIMNWESHNEDIFHLGFYRKNEFSKKAYENGLYRIQMSSQAYREYKENEILARKYLQILENSIAVSDETLWQLYSLATESATIDAVRILPTDIEKTLKPASDAEIQKYLADNDADIKTWYDSHIKNYTTPEKVNVQQIVIQKSFARLDHVGSKTQKNLNHEQRYEIARKQLIDEKLEFNQGYEFYDESEVKLNNGVQGLTVVDSLSTEYQQALEGKKVGDVVAVDLKDAFIIAKILDRTAKIVTPYDDVKFEIAKSQFNDSRVQSRRDEVSANMVALIKSGKSLEEALNDSLYSGISAEAPVAVAAAPEIVADGSAEPVAAPVVVAAPETVIPLSDRVTPNSYTYRANASSIAGIGTSDALIRDVYNTEVGQTLANAYVIDDALVFARVTDKKSADRAQFDNVKDQVRDQVIKMKMADLIGVPNEIINLRGERGRWLEQKLASAKVSGRVKVYDNFFSTERQRLAKRAEERNKDNSND